MGLDIVTATVIKIGSVPLELDYFDLWSSKMGNILFLPIFELQRSKTLG